MPRSSIDFFQLSPLPMWISDVNTQLFLDVNQAAILFYGYEREEFLQMTMQDIEAAQRLNTPDKGVTTHRKKCGAVVYAHMTSNAIEFQNKQACLYLVSDLTERMETERKMQESAERFNIVSKATSDTIWDYTLASEQIVWNKGIKGIFGHKNIVDYTTSSDWWYFCVHPDDRLRVLNKIRYHLREKIAKWQAEYRFMCGDGSYRHVFDRGFLVFDEEGTPVKIIGAMEDVTKRKEYIKAIEAQNKKFKEIAWIQSHVVRAPLARIMALVDLIRVDPPDVDCDVMLEYLSSSARELDSIIVNIADKTPVP